MNIDEIIKQNEIINNNLQKIKKNIIFCIYIKLTK